jgi:YlmC/YmxH family sporulation protein
MRYSELAGKEIIDISEGTRMGVATSTDLMLDTATGTVTALVIFQRNGFLAAREIAVPWAGIKKIGRDLIIVDMSAAPEQELSVPVAPIEQVAVRRVARHRVPGTDEPPVEVLDDSPQQLLSRLAEGEAAVRGPFWRREGARLLDKRPRVGHNRGDL